MDIFSSPFTCNAGLLGPSLSDVCSASEFFVFMSLFNALARRNNNISGACKRVKPIKKPDEKYDFIVIGGGAGGSAVAARLSEIPDWKVLLLEAGPDEPVGTEIPGFSFQFLKTGITWNYKTTNETNACLSTNGSCAWPSGRNLGGNSVHNQMIYLRGNRKDYDGWAAEGNEGWTWEEVKPFFLKGEDNGEIERVGTTHHGKGGPQSVERFPHVPPLGYLFLDASREAGYGVSEDLNGDTQTGFSRIQATVKNGVRQSSAAAYLRPIRNRRNLHVSLNSIATRVIIKNDKAVGVEFYKDGEKKTVYVTREVIISGGAVKSPQILLLSGIGPKKHLESVGIKVVKDLPGVGQNLQDHPCAPIPFTINEADVYEDNWAVVAEYLYSQTGPLSSTGLVQVVGLLATNATTPDYPNLEIFVAGYAANCAPGEIGALRSCGKRTIGILISYLHPKSRGNVALASKDPFQLPVIRANYLYNPQDLDRMIDGVRLAQKLLSTKALRDYNFTFSASPFVVCSDLEFNSDEYWGCVIKQNNFPLYHQVGTCKMGPASDPMAVVDPRLRVHGIDRLRVVDASVMPKVISGNTVAPTMMIGERGSDFIKKDWARR